MKKLFLLLCIFAAATTAYSQIEIDQEATSECVCDSGTPQSIILIAEGEAGPFTFSWEGPEGYTSTEQSLYDVTTAGTYRVTVTNAFECETVLEQVMKACEELKIVGLESAVKHPSDCGVADGSIYFPDNPIRGGVAPYTMRLFDDQGALIPGNYRWTGLVPANYTLQVEDAMGCQLNQEIMLRGAIYLVFETEAPCEDEANGAILLLIESQAAYTVEWSTGDQSSSDQIVPELNNLPAGEYCVTITDTDMNCTLTDCVELQDIDSQFEVAAEVTHACQNRGGSVTLDILNYEYTGPNSVPTILWSDGSDQLERTNLNPGTYCVSVSDQCGYVQTECYDIRYEPSEAPPLVVEGETTPTCDEALGQNRGTIDITVTGGTPPYSFIWSNGARTEDLRNLSRNSYCVTVIDSDGCLRNTRCFEINDVTFDYHITELSHCIDGCDEAVIEVQAFYTHNGNSEDFMYEWSAYEVGHSYFEAEGARLDEIPYPGTYYLRITDQNGCSTVSQIEIYEDCADVPDIPDLVDDRSDTYQGYTIYPVSSAFPNGQIIIGSAFNRPEFTYKWDGPSGFTYDGLNLYDSDSGGEGRYTLTISNGCEKKEFSFDIPSCPTDLSVEAVDICSDCIQYGFGQGTFRINNPAPNTIYYYYVGEGRFIPINLDQNNEFQVRLSHREPGEFQLLVVDNDLCGTTADFRIEPNNSVLGIYPMVSYFPNYSASSTFEPWHCHLVYTCINGECSENYGLPVVDRYDNTIPSLGRYLFYTYGQPVSINVNPSNCTGNYSCGSQQFNLYGYSDYFYDQYDSRSNQCVSGEFCVLNNAFSSPWWRFINGEGYNNERYDVKVRVPSRITNSYYPDISFPDFNSAELLTPCEVQTECGGSVVDEKFYRRDIETINRNFQVYNDLYGLDCQCGVVLEKCGPYVVSATCLSTDLLGCNSRLIPLEQDLTHYRRGNSGVEKKIYQEQDLNFDSLTNSSLLNRNIIPQSSNVEYDSNKISIDDAQSDEKLSIFPNPSSGQVNINVYEELIDKTINIILFNSKGEIVLSKSLSLNGASVELDLSSMPKGLYLLQVFTATIEKSKIHEEKLILQ